MLDDLYTSFKGVGPLRVGSPEWVENLERISPPGSTGEHILRMGAFFGKFPIPHLGKGVYQTSNFGNLLRDIGFQISDYPETDTMRAWTEAHKNRIPGVKIAPFPQGEPNSYGVADDLGQVLIYLAPFIEHPTRTFVISIGEVHRNLANAGQGGGWRWHKWGPYIGKHEITTEYLDDEPFIEKVLLFHITEILGDEEPS